MLQKTLSGKFYISQLFMKRYVVESDLHINLEIISKYQLCSRRESCR